MALTRAARTLRARLSHRAVAAWCRHRSRRARPSALSSGGRKRICSARCQARASSRSTCWRSDGRRRSGARDRSPRSPAAPSCSIPAEGLFDVAAELARTEQELARRRQAGAAAGRLAWLGFQLARRRPKRSSASASGSTNSATRLADPRAPPRTRWLALERAPPDAVQTARLCARQTASRWLGLATRTRRGRAWPTSRVASSSTSSRWC